MGARTAKQLKPQPRPRLIRSQTYKVCQDGSVEVYDLDFAAYCGIRDLAIVDMYEVADSRPREFVFRFAADEQAIRQLSIDYANSESARHADCVRRYKKGIRPVRRARET